MTITVSGASDDTVEISGDITEEFPWQPPGYGQTTGDILAFSDGTVLRINLDRDGWRITRLACGTSAFTLEQHTDGEEGTDKATLEAAEWVVQGIGMVTR